VSALYYLGFSTSLASRDVALGGAVARDATGATARHFCDFREEKLMSKAQN
jgi:hypothetical protein